MTLANDNPTHEDLLTSLRWLRVLRGLGLAEGVTLVLLVGVAVPVKHLAGIPSLVSAAGPVHGLVFLLYLWLSIRLAIAQGWRRQEVLRLCGVAFVPFGAFFNDRFLKRKLIELGDQISATAPTLQKLEP